MTFWPFFSHFVSGCFFFFFFFPFSLIIHSFQEGKHAAGTNFPGRVNVPSCPKWLPFPMFPQKKQPCQLSPGLLFCTLGCLERVPVGQMGSRMSRLSLKMGVRTSELPPLHCAGMSFHFLPSFSLEVKKFFQILPTSAYGSFSPRKCKFSPELHNLFPQELSFQEELVWL